MALPYIANFAISTGWQIIDLARRTVAEMRAGTPLSRLALDGIALLLGTHLLRRHSNHAGPIGMVHDALSRDWRLSRAIELLEARLGHDIAVAELAAAVDLSASHLIALFRAGTGEPPHRWLMRRRIERACERLADPRESITEIAIDLGFASSQHFATAFRRRMGVTPSEYRRERLA